MKVKYKNESGISLTNGKVYEVISVENGMYRIVDDTGEDYLFYPSEFEVVSNTYRSINNSDDALKEDAMMTKSALEYIIERVICSALESAADSSEDDEFSIGKRTAYYEILDTIKNELVAHDADLSKYKLDFELESLL